MLGILALLNFGEPRPFTGRQLSLLEAFANQAAIAIATAELFRQVEQRSTELLESNRQVSESLDQQMALSEVLREIAASPSDPQRVLDAICETAARLCDTPDAAIHRYRARDGHLAICAATRAGYNWTRQVYGTTDFDLVGGSR